MEDIAGRRSASSDINLGGTSELKRNSSSEHGGGGIVNQGTTALSGSVNITDNLCATNGDGIWNNGTLRMDGNIQIKENDMRVHIKNVQYYKKRHPK